VNGALDKELPVGAYTPRSDSIQHAGLATAMNSTGAWESYFTGTIDEARVWNRALGPAEILANKDLELTSGTGLVARWGMNEGVGSTIASSVGTFPGTLTDGPAWVAGFPLPDAIPPAAPTGLGANGGAGFVTLGWTANVEPDLAGYNLYRNEASGGPYSKVNGPLIVGTTYSVNTVAPGTLYYYVLRAVDTSANESGNSNDANATATIPATGLSFNGTNQSVTFGAAPGLGLATLTLEAWVRWTGGGTTASSGSGGVTAIPLLTKGLHESDGSNVDCHFLGITPAGLLTADFEDYATGLNHPLTGVATVASDGTWAHVAATYDGTAWRLDVNGAPDKELLIGAYTPRSNSVQHVGLGTALNSTGVTEGRFAGVIDEARIWSGARSGAEIVGTINSEVTSGTNLVARWGMNEGTGSTIVSSVGSFPGTLVGSPTWVVGAPFNISFTPPTAPTNLTATLSPGSQIDLARQRQ
jgi:hypothetical protein